MQGEVKHFVKEFEDKKGDKEVNDIFEILQKTTELGDFEVDNLKAQCDSVLPSINANLLVAQSMADKILTRDSRSEIEQALESSKAVRDKEWSSFKSEVVDKRSKVDQAYLQKEQDLKKHYQHLEEQLSAEKD